MATTITVKKIPQDLYDKLRKRAKQNHRSINGEIITILEDTLCAQRVHLKDILASARALREKTSSSTLTQEYINRAKRESRL